MKIVNTKLLLLTIVFILNLAGAAFAQTSAGWDWFEGSTDDYGEGIR